MNDEMRDRHEELLVTRALFGLSEPEQRELSMLQLRMGAPDNLSLDIAAAAVELACAGDALPEPVPSRVLEQAAEQARRHFEEAATRKATTGPRVLHRASPPHTGTLVIPPSVEANRGAGPTEVIPPTEAALVAPVLSFTPPPSKVAKRAGGVQLAGWLMAAACLALAIVGWWPTRIQSAIDTARAGLTVPAVEPPATSPAAARESLLARAQDLIRIEWESTEDPAAAVATGDVVWSPVAQQGYMRIRGLTPNDRGQSQYQLWIFDKNQDPRFPIDGGVFDVDQAGEVVVPISAKLNVVEPTLFAITVEKPGGVVVSKRERIVLTAANG